MIDYQEQYLSNFYSVLFVFSVIALDRQILCELFFSALNLGLVFVIWLTIRLSIDFVNLLAKNFLVTLN